MIFILIKNSNIWNVLHTQCDNIHTYECNCIILYLYILSILDSRYSVGLFKMKQTNLPTKPLKEEFQNIRSFNLVDKTSNFIEKIFWAFISLGGTAWIVYFIMTQFIQYDRNPIIITKDSWDISNIKFPAVTFCPKVTSDIAIVEQMANYINPKQKIPQSVLAIRNEGKKLIIAGSSISKMT